MKENSEKLFYICKNFKVIEDTKLWQSISNSWWFDSDYLIHNLNLIKIYYATIEDYMNLPRSRGSGHKIESWLISVDLDKKFNFALNQIKNIISGEE
ncbi:hypothetical protein [Nostoc sp.]